MTQPYYPPQQPQYPPAQPGYPPPVQGFPFLANPGAAQNYAQPGTNPGWGNGYPGYQQSQQVPPQQGAPSTLADFYSQPNSASGPSLTKNSQPGYVWVGVVSRDVLDSDVKQATKHPSQGGGLDFNADGTPKRVMMVPLERVARVHQGQMYASPEHPEGNATLYVQGNNLRTEFSRACNEAGMPQGTPPRKGTVIMLELRGKKPTNGGAGIPANDWACTVTLPEGQAPVAAPPPSQALAQPAAPYPAAPLTPPRDFNVPQGYTPSGDQQIPQQPMLPGLGQPLGAPQQQLQAQPVQPQQAPQTVSSGAQQTGQGLTPPAGLSESEAAILARLAGQQNQATG